MSEAPRCAGGARRCPARVRQPRSGPGRPRGGSLLRPELQEGAPTRVLGVDPGSFHTGWGLIGGSPDRPSLLDCGVLRIPARLSFSLRLHRLGEEFELLLTRLAPTCAAVEMPFHGANARAALQLAHARGVLMAVLGGLGIAVMEYTPATVKKSVTGNGRAEKAQVQVMVGRLLALHAVPASTDTSDALAVALCHLSLQTSLLERAGMGR